MSECTYGLAKRLQFVSELITRLEPQKILDVGCGTGDNLTQQLAKMFPEYRFVGIDSDMASINYANSRRTTENIEFFVADEQAQLGRFDLVIASEVIEHVESPTVFLEFLTNSVEKDGNIILTLPNGFGPFECAAMLEAFLHFIGVLAVVRFFKRLIVVSLPKNQFNDTLAISPHINFFSYSKFNTLITDCGFRVGKYQARTFLCGFGFDHLIKSEQILSWNAKVAGRLPPQFVSAWMFLLIPPDRFVSCEAKASLFSRFRRYINEVRWGLR